MGYIVFFLTKKLRVNLFCYIRYTLDNDTLLPPSTEVQLYPLNLTDGHCVLMGSEYPYYRIRGHCVSFPFKLINSTLLL